MPERFAIKRCGSYAMVLGMYSVKFICTYVSTYGSEHLVNIM